MPPGHVAELRHKQDDLALCDTAAHIIYLPPDRQCRQPAPQLGSPTLRAELFQRNLATSEIVKTADPPEALIALSGQIHLFSQNQSRPALGLARALDYS